ncbi:hypothetical protein ACHAXT_000766 [Thalassiosira profunda]
MAMASLLAMSLLWALPSSAPPAAAWAPPVVPNAARTRLWPSHHRAPLMASVPPPAVATDESVETLKHLTVSELKERLRSMGQKDAVLFSPTGTGKTLAYTLPLAARLWGWKHDGSLQHQKQAQKQRFVRQQNRNRNDSLSSQPVDPATPSILVVEPSRELARQVGKVWAKFHPTAAKNNKRQVVTVYGGVPMARHAAMLGSKTDVVIGTPGRIRELIREKYLSTAHLRSVVLDEADTLLNFKDNPEVEWLLEGMQNDYQLVLASATVNKRVEKFVGDVMELEVGEEGYVVVEGDDTDAIDSDDIAIDDGIELDPDDASSNVNTANGERSRPTVQHWSMAASAASRIGLTSDLIVTMSPRRGIIFAPSKAEVEAVAQELTERLSSANDVSVHVLHGDMVQAARGRTGSLRGGGSINFYSDQPEVDYWMPPHVVDDNNEEREYSDAPIVVDFRCACFKLTDISTVYFTAVIKFVVVFEWNDPRLKGMPITTNDLPGDLWGPDIILENAQNDCEVMYDSFALLNAETGRLKRTVTFHGHVYNPMDLKQFPFDMDDLELKFISICNWRTLDESRHGNDPVNQIYVLRPMHEKKGVDFFLLGWGGKINEFLMLGYTEKTTNTTDDPSKPIVFQFDIHLGRKAQYYILKILLPLWLITVTSLAPYGIETDDFQGRLEVIFTLLLSTVALLYVVQESIPKISSLTLVDKVVLATLISLSLSVLFSYFISRSPNATQLNFILAVTNQVLFWIANIVLLVPPYFRYKQHIAKMEAKDRTAGKESMRSVIGGAGSRGKSYRFEESVMNGRSGMKRRSFALRTNETPKN